MFKTMQLPAAERRPVVKIFVDNRHHLAQQGDTVAAALFKAAVVHFRHTPVSGQARAPLCLMGVCFECLVEIDGVQNVQSCMVPVHEGMQVRLPAGARRAGDPA